MYDFDNFNDFDNQHVEEGMDNQNNSSETNDINESIFNYRTKDINFLNSPAPINEEDVVDMNHDERDLIEFAVEEDNKNVSDVSRGRLIENTKSKNEINKKEEKKEKEEDEEKEEELPLIANAMMWVSLSVSAIFYFIVLAFLFTRNVKWVYIIVSEVILETFARLIKIVSMRFDHAFLMRPGKCINHKYEKNIAFYKNFLLTNLVKEEDKKIYSSRGFPSNHVTKCVSFITLTYLFFPKYRKILRIVGPIYILLVIYSRMYLNCHTLLQSIGGVVVGYFGSNLLYKIICGLGLA
jgi:membrane-associated phospholipid phosphatase